MGVLHGILAVYNAINHRFSRLKPAACDSYLAVSAELKVTRKQRKLAFPRRGNVLQGFVHACHLHRILNNLNNKELKIYDAIYNDVAS